MNYLMCYIDKQQAAIKALQDYPIMETIYRTRPADLHQAALETIQDQPKPPATVAGKPTTTPDPTGQTATKIIDQQTILENRYNQAKNYLNWFLPVWAALTDQERTILEAFYLSEQSQEQTIKQAQTHLGLSKSTLYRARNKAAQRLARGLYG